MRNKSKRLFSYLLIIMITLVIIAPFIWMVSTSLKEPAKVFEFPPSIIPRPVTFRNYAELPEVQPHFPRRIDLPKLKQALYITPCPVHVY